MPFGEADHKTTITILKILLGKYYWVLLLHGFLNFQEDYMEGFF